jgi:hypothetical protein
MLGLPCAYVPLHPIRSSRLDHILVETVARYLRPSLVAVVAGMPPRINLLRYLLDDSTVLSKGYPSAELRYCSWYTPRRRRMLAEPTHTFINPAHLTSSFTILSTVRYVMTLLPPDLPTSLTVHIFSVVLDVDLVARVLRRG